MPLTYKQIVDISQELDWTIEVTNDDELKSVTLDFEMFTSSGEDFYFSVTAETPEQVLIKIQNESLNFDIEEHVYLWLDAKYHNHKGIPKIEDILNSAEEIKQSLQKLSDTLNKKNNQ